MAEDESVRIEQNLNMIRRYLAKSFVGFDIIEDKSDQRVCHCFTLRKWLSVDRLSDGSAVEEPLANVKLKGGEKDYGLPPIASQAERRRSWHIPKRINAALSS